MFIRYTSFLVVVASTVMIGSCGSKSTSPPVARAIIGPSPVPESPRSTTATSSGRAKIVQDYRNGRSILLHRNGYYYLYGKNDSNGCATDVGWEITTYIKKKAGDSFSQRGRQLDQTSGQLVGRSGYSTVVYAHDKFQGDGHGLNHTNPDEHSGVDYFARIQFSWTDTQC